MYEPREWIDSGHLACAGCGATVAMRFALKALGEKTIIVLPACCWTILAGPFPYSAVKVPLFHTAFETGASTAAGVKAGLEIRGDTETIVAAWVGDGGTFDIGIQALSGAAERNDDIIYFCYDNEAYMNTGIQRSSATPFGTWTTTTPANHPKGQPKKNMVEIMAAHRIPYTATCSVAFPEDMMRKVAKAKSIRGTKFIHIFSPCPTGWRAPSSRAIKIARLAVHTKVFPLYEIEDGIRYIINVEPKNLPVEEYLRLQGRFNHLTDEDIQNIQRNIDREWERLVHKALLS
jgi:pyruvate/2-oxoacid:ferredoxin oxidoreductase beta subunit